MKTITIEIKDGEHKVLSATLKRLKKPLEEIALDLLREKQRQIECEDLGKQLMNGHHLNQDFTSELKDAIKTNGYHLTRLQTSDYFIAYFLINDVLLKTMKQKKYSRPTSYKVNYGFGDSLKITHNFKFRIKRDKQLIEVTDLKTKSTYKGVYKDRWYTFGRHTSASAIESFGFYLYDLLNVRNAGG
jgi:hypothetical protein